MIRQLWLSWSIFFRLICFLGCNMVFIQMHHRFYTITLRLFLPILLWAYSISLASLFYYRNIGITLLSSVCWDVACFHCYAISVFHFLQSFDSIACLECYQKKCLIWYQCIHDEPLHWKYWKWLLHLHLLFYFWLFHWGWSLNDVETLNRTIPGFLKSMKLEANIWWLWVDLWLGWAYVKCYLSIMSFENISILFMIQSSDYMLEVLFFFLMFVEFLR